MNNFFLNQDPLLGQNSMQYDQIPNPILFQQAPPIKDGIGELDKTLKGLSPAVLDKLGKHPRFAALNSNFQDYVQKELLALVRSRLNANSSVISNVNEQIEIINEVKRSVENEKEESINEMNDYMKNYSHLTFDDYKRLKNGEPIDEINNKKKK